MSKFDKIQKKYNDLGPTKASKLLSPTNYKEYNARMELKRRRIRRIRLRQEKAMLEQVVDIGIF